MLVPLKISDGSKPNFFWMPVVMAECTRGKPVVLMLAVNGRLDFATPFTSA